VNTCSSSPGPGLNFSYCSLSNSSWEYVDLKDALLVGTTLTSSNLDYGDFEDANLSGAKIGYAFLYGADFTGANLTGANLGGVFLSGAIFTGVTWSDTVCPDYTNSDSDGGTCINDL